MSLLRVKGISKHYGGVIALDKIDFEIDQAEVHGLVGENGAGKSTFIKILGGVVKGDEGDIVFDETQVNFENPLQSRLAGISIIHQELSVLPDLNVIENVFMGRMPSRYGIINWKEMAKQTKDIISSVGLEIDPFVELSALSISQRQLIEIAKSLWFKSKLIVMDEPNSSLTKKESKKLFELISELKSKGVSVLYISHKLEEVIELCDRISVFRDGQFVERMDGHSVDENTLINSMVGRELKRVENIRELKNEIILNVDSLCGDGFDDVSFQIPKGSITCFAGLVGAGRSELARAIFGANAIASGKVEYKGEECRFESPRRAIEKGVVMLAEDRKTLSLFMDQSIEFNMELTKLLKDRRRFVIKSLKSFLEPFKNKLNVKMSGYGEEVSNLSGGNQQKTVLTRWLATEPEILILDEPTHGVDVGAKMEIYQLIKNLADEGMTIMLISSEMEEILALSERVVVMHQGKLQKVLEGNDINEENILTLALGMET